MSSSFQWQRVPALRVVAELLGKSGNHAALLINGNKGGMPGFLFHKLLDFLAQSGELLLAFHVLAKQNYIANFIFFYQPDKFLTEL